MQLLSLCSHKFSKSLSEAFSFIRKTPCDAIVEVKKKKQNAHMVSAVDGL